MKQIQRKKNSKIALLAKMGAFKSIGGANATLHTLFGDVKETIYEETISDEEKMIICPLSVNFNFMNKWQPFIQKYIKFGIDKIEHLDSNADSQIISGIIYDKNLKDKIEEAITRGRSAPVLKDGLSKYCNFILEDDTDFVTCRIATRNFERFKNLIFQDTTASDILLIKGRMGDGIRMFFINEIINLRIFKEKIEKRTKDYTESELILTGNKQSPRRWKNSY